MSIARICKASAKLLLLSSLWITPVAWSPAAAEQVELTFDQARVVAIQALQNRRPDLALAIADKLLRSDPGDAEAHFIRARALHQKRRYQAGRKAAADAFRYGRDDDIQFHAAQLAATLAVKGDRYDLAKYWLRQSLTKASHPQQRDQTIRDFRKVRQRSPSRMSFKFSMVPTNNLNNGAESAISEAEGVPLYGELNGDAQALSGLRTTASLSWSRRLSASEQHDTRLEARLLAQRARMSRDARAQADILTDSDLSYDSVKIGLRHQQRISASGTASFAIRGESSWYSRAPLHHSVEAELGYSHKLSGGDRVTFTYLGKSQDPQRQGSPEIQSHSIRIGYSAQMQNGDRLRFGLSARKTNSSSDNSRGNKISAQATYGFGKPVGPVKLSVTLGHTWQHFPDYYLISRSFTVPGGRKDQSLYGNVSFRFHQIDYAGFTPVVTLQARKTQSNVSRFTSNEVSISLGVTSSF